MFKKRKNATETGIICLERDSGDLRFQVWLMGHRYWVPTRQDMRGSLFEWFSGTIKLCALYWEPPSKGTGAEKGGSGNNLRQLPRHSCNSHACCMNQVGHVSEPAFSHVSAKRTPWLKVRYTKPSTLNRLKHASGANRV